MPAIKSEAKTSFAASPVKTPTTTIPKPDGTEVTVHAIPVLPASPFRTFSDDARHGIEYSYDAAEVISNFDPARPLPLDVEHATETGAADTRSRGWAYALVTADHAPDLGLEPGVLYGLFELNELGLEALANKHFGYTSAVSLGGVTSESSFRITSVKSNALTNNPATEMPVAFTRMPAPSSVAGNDAYTSHRNSFSSTGMEQLIAILGLAEGSTEADVAAAVQALVTAAAAAAEAAPAATDSTAEAVAAAMTALTALTEKVDALATDVQAVKGKSAAFSANLSKQVTPATPAAASAAASGKATFGLTADQMKRADALGYSYDVFAKAASDMARSGRVL